MDLRYFRVIRILGVGGYTILITLITYITVYVRVYVYVYMFACICVCVCVCVFINLCACVGRVRVSLCNSVYV